MSKRFLEKQKERIYIKYAEWSDDWETLFVRLDDNSTYKLSRDFVKNNNLLWGEKR